MADANPFAALSLIVAPAILTNACSLLSMSTSNRLARAVMLLGALRSFYISLGGFAMATLVSLLGAVLIRFSGPFVLALEIAALASGAVGVGALVHGAVLLVRETRIAVYVLRERAAAVRARVRA